MKYFTKEERVQKWTEKATEQAKDEFVKYWSEWKN